MDDDEVVLAAQAGEPVADVLEALLEHFHGCPTPTGRAYDCDYCQQTALGRSGT